MVWLMSQTTGFWVATRSKGPVHQGRPPVVPPDSDAESGPLGVTRGPGGYTGLALHFDLLPREFPVGALAAIDAEVDGTPDLGFKAEEHTRLGLHVSEEGIHGGVV